MSLHPLQHARTFPEQLCHNAMSASDEPFTASELQLDGAGARPSSRTSSSTTEREDDEEQSGDATEPENQIEAGQQVPTSPKSLPAANRPASHRMPRPLIINTEATPPPSPEKSSKASQPPPSPIIASRPNTKKIAASSIRKLFRRSPSDTGESLSGESRSSSMPSYKDVNGTSVPQSSASLSEMGGHSCPSSGAHTPPTPGALTPPRSRSSTGRQDLQDGVLTPQTLSDEPPRRPSRSSTGLSLKMIGFSTSSKLNRPVETRIRSPSSSSIHDRTATASPFSLHAVEGAGLKARRLSSQLPADFHVDTCELDLEFVSVSKIGRRKEVGRGATATVKIMVRKGETKGPQYAVKEFRKRSPKEDEAEYVQKVVSEFSIANSLHHPNIVKTVRLCTHAGRWDHVMEYCQLGELFSLVERKYLKQEDKVCFFKQLVRGVAYLHYHGIAHRDIKLENLLLNDQGHVKITDFGVSEVFCGEHPGLRSSAGECGKNMKECRKSAPGICGSMPYIAPEVLAKKGEYDPRPLDIWSCAILYIALVHGGNAWQQADKSDTQYRRFAEGWEDFLKQDSDRAINESNMPDCGRVIDLLPTSGQRRLILRMLHPNPEKRITIREVLKNPWVKGIECCCPDDESSDTEAPIGIDVAQKGSCKIAKKMKVLKKHDHLPPPVKRLPQHKFDMGDGTSRYD